MGRYGIWFPAKKGSTPVYQVERLTMVEALETAKTLCALLFPQPDVVIVRKME
jgi:hypothetical protein